MNTHVHVYAVVRVKVIGVKGENPRKIGDSIADAVSADPREWLQPVYGSVRTKDGASYDIEAVEFAEEVSWVLVDELDDNGDVAREHHFDARMEPMESLNGAYTAREARLERQLQTALEALHAAAPSIRVRAEHSVT